MLILIHETHNSISSQYKIQGTIQQTIKNFGVGNNDSPVKLASKLRILLHTAHRLYQTIDTRNLLVLLRQHVQAQGSQIDSVI